MQNEQNATAVVDAVFGCHLQDSICQFHLAKLDGADG